jgi:hypothetical protein
MNDRDLEKKYRQLKQEDAPDLWARIDAGLQSKEKSCSTAEISAEKAEASAQADAENAAGNEENPVIKRAPAGGEEAASSGENASPETGRPEIIPVENSAGIRKFPSAAKIACGFGAAAAVVFLSFHFLRPFSVRTSSMKLAAVTAAASLPAQNNNSEKKAAAAVGATAAARAAKVPDTMPYFGDLAPEKEAVPDNSRSDQTTGQAASKKTAADNTAVQKAPGNGSRQGAELAPVSLGSLGISYYTETIPEGTVTVTAEDSAFAEHILKNADVLSVVTVRAVSFVRDSTGAVSLISYTADVERTCYTKYPSSVPSEITITSPVIVSESDGKHMLYAMATSGKYILPLRISGSDYELVTAGTPQIAIGRNNAVVFHEGYRSLMTTATGKITDGSSSPANPSLPLYYRADTENVITDLTRLVRKYAK